VLLVHSNPAVRDQLAADLQSAGISLTVAGRIAEVERWPAGDVVITEERLFTPFWLSVGAAHVVVLTSGTDAANFAEHRSVTAVASSGEALLAAVDSFRLVAA
jgi:CheY-like chemotaxis protein